MKIRDRIKELRRVPANQLKPNPKNWRVHTEEQGNALRSLLAQVGFAGAVLARELSDKSLMLIDGHLRAETSGTEKVPVLILDVNETEADLILATFDPVGSMAIHDPEKIDNLLAELTIESLELTTLIAELGTKQDDKETPDEFPAFGDDLKTENECPKCGFEF